MASIISQLLLLILCLTVSNQASAKLTKTEQEILENFAQRCDNLIINAAQFPDAFLDNSAQSSCEIASIFLGKQYELKTAINTSANIAANIGALSNEEFNSMQVRAQHFGYSVDNDVNIRRFSLRTDDPLYLKHALTGDPYSIWNLSFNEAFSPFRGGKGLSLKEAETIGQYIGPTLSDFVFLTQEQLKKKYPDYQSLTEAAKELVDQSDQISRQYLQLATANLIHAADLRNDHEENWFVEALMFPHDLRVNLLKLDAMTGMMGDGLRDTIQIIEYGAEDKYRFFHLGTDLNFFEVEQKSVGNELLDCAVSLADAIKGLPTVFEASFYASCLKEIEGHDPGTLEYLSQIFVGEPVERYGNFDYRKYKDWSPDKPDPTEDKIFSKLFVADLRYIFLNPDESSKHDFDAQAKFLKNRPIDAYEVVTKNISPVALLYFHKNSDQIHKNAKNDLKSLTKTVANDDHKGCGVLSRSQCKKAWRALDFEDFFKKNIHVGLPSLSQASNSCTAKGSLIKKLLRHKYWAGNFSRRLANNCPRSVIEPLFDWKGSVNAFLANLTAFPSNATGITLLRNSDFYLEKNFGQLAAHLLSSTPQKSVTVLPHATFNVLALSDSSMATLHRALLRTSPLRSVHETVTDKNRYWKGVVPFGSLAESFSMRGANQLAFVAKTRQLNQTIEAPEYYGVASARIILQDAMIFARQAGIPSNFIALFAERYSREINEKLQKKNINDVKADLNSNNFNGDDSISILINSSSFTGKNPNLLNYNSMFEDYKNTKDFRQFFLRAISIPHEEIKNVCRSKNEYKIVKSFYTTPEITKQLSERFLLTTNVYFQFARFSSICRVTAASMVLRDHGELIDLYDDFMEIQLLPFLALGGTPSHPSFFSLLSELSWASGKEGKPLGGVITLALLKNNLATLTESFIQRNSSLLRDQQTQIETVLTNLIYLSGSLKETSDDKKIRAFADSLYDTATRLAVNFSIPILSNKTRSRFVFRTSQPSKTELETPYGEEFLKITHHFAESSKLTAQSTTPTEYVLNSAERALHGQWARFNAFEIFNTADHFLKTEGSASMSKEDFLLNIIAANDHIVIQVLSKKTDFHTVSKAINPKILANLKASILTKKDIDQNDVKLACELFSPVHDWFGGVFASSSRRLNILVTPSVNLLPIPSELIIGSACRDFSEVAIVHTGDVLASVELLKSKDNFSIPNSFVGVGNPIAESGGFEIAFGEDLKRGGISPDNTFDISQFPPLPSAATEVDTLSKLFEKSVVLQDTKASISQALRISAEESKRNSKTAIVLATHGVAVDYASGVTLPGLLSSDDGSLSLVTNLQLESFDLQSSVVALSACDTATGFTDRSDQYFTGFVTSFANSGSDVVVASLWPVISSASKNLTEKFFAEWKASNFMNGVRSSKVAVNDNYAGLPFVYIYP